MLRNFLEIFYLLTLNCHSLNELFKHLNAVSFLYISLISCEEALLRRNNSRFNEQGVADNVFFVLDVERLPLIHVSGKTAADS